VICELIELLDRHCDSQVLLFPVGDQFDDLPFRLRVLGELLEPTSFYEDSNHILHIDAVIS
jgi:hypothetical protein